MPKKPTEKKLNPYSKRNVIPCRFDNEELKELVTKAKLYHDGNESECIRAALAAYRPYTKVEKYANAKGKKTANGS